ncbi:MULTISPECIES: copper resistance CopC family protein [Microbacterium]|uniref:copper resistance CopC family protein n=1 Tax=Microbacterium TaxID=33882 RepID=UPI0027865FD9|nr:MULTISPECIES: copper resistance CopC family protein [Microbacterium]MDQ1083606.1 methionine-rich copper-binding protein CopC [Microbacterium sp. SORGH_AS_0344]MDQ1171118.1 methionine-rich copper-binding protein CopC [Microbacterium proteolyticum]
MRSPRAPRRRTLPAVVATAILAAAALLVPALPAAAHDELIGSDPSSGAVLETLPAQITLSYSADVLPDAGATVIEVTDAAGTSLTDGDPEVSGAQVTQALAGPASGAVTVRWRVVSSDGHPIDGEFAFSVPESSPTPTPSATTTASPVATASEAPSPAATTTEVTVPLESDAPASPLPWILLAVALVIVAGVLVYVFASRGPRNTAGRGGSGR